MNHKDAYEVAREAEGRAAYIEQQMTELSRPPWDDIQIRKALGIETWASLSLHTRVAATALWISKYA